MKLFSFFTKDGRLNIPWWLWLMQGVFVVIVGFVFSLASIFNPTVAILSVADFSWLPVIGILIMLLGAFECIDAVFSLEVCDFMQRMNAGALDLIFGTLLIFDISDTPDRLGLMIALYLLTRSVLQAVFAMKLKISQLGFNLFISAVSFVLGLMVWLQWPTSESWFFSFGLSTNLVFRGLLMIYLSIYIRRKMSPAYR